MSVVFLVAKLCLFCDPMDCSLPGSTVHRVSQARILEWVVISFSGGFSWPKDWTYVSYIDRQNFLSLSHQGSLICQWKLKKKKRQSKAGEKQIVLSNYKNCKIRVLGIPEGENRKEQKRYFIWNNNDWKFPWINVREQTTDPESSEGTMRDKHPPQLYLALLFSN